MSAPDSLGRAGEALGFLSLIFILRGTPHGADAKKRTSVLDADGWAQDQESKLNDPPPEKAGSRTRKGK
jgi:hypothetical protein